MSEHYEQIIENQIIGRPFCLFRCHQDQFPCCIYDYDRDDNGEQRACHQNVPREAH